MTFVHLLAVFAVIPFVALRAADTPPERKVTDWTKGELVNLPRLTASEHPDESDPAHAKYAAPLAPPPGTPVLDAAELKNLHEICLRPVIVKFSIARSNFGTMPASQPKDDRPAPLLEEFVIRDSPLLLRVQGVEVARHLHQSAFSPAEGGKGPVPRTLFAAGILEPRVDLRTQKLRPHLNIYSIRQLSEHSERVCFPWQTRRWFAAEWPPYWQGMALPRTLTMSENPPGASVRLKTLQMRPDAVAASIVPVAACFSPAAGAGRFVVEDVSYLSEGDVAGAWHATIYRELERQAAAKKTWPKGFQLSLLPGGGYGSPWGAPDAVQPTASAAVIEAILTRRTLRSDVAIAAAMDATGRLQPCRLLAERLSAASAAGVTSVIVAGNCEAELTTAAYVLGAAAFTKLNIIGAATVEEAAAFASEEERQRLSAVAARIETLAKLPAAQLMAVLSRDVALRELQSLSVNTPRSLSALMLYKAGKKELPLEPLAAARQGFRLPPAVSRARLVELLSWDYSQYPAYHGDTWPANGQHKGWSTSSVFNVHFGSNLEAAVIQLQRPISPVYSRACQAALRLAGAAAKLKRAPDDPGSARFRLKDDPPDTSLAAEWAACQDALDTADGKKPNRDRGFGGFIDTIR